MEIDGTASCERPSHVREHTHYPFLGISAGWRANTQVVEQKVFEEIKNCTYRDAEGFFEKYFDGKDWTRRALDVYKLMKDRHVDDVLTGPPDPPLQAEVLEW